MPKILFVLKVFLKDSPKTDNKYNKLILDFLNDNIAELNSYGCYIRLVLLNNTNIDKFLKMNIKNVPALYDDDTKSSIIGVENIIKYIIYKCSPTENNDDHNSNNNGNSNYSNRNNNKHSNTTTGGAKKSSMKNMNDDGDPTGLRGYLINELLKDDEFDEPVDTNTLKSKEEYYKKNKDTTIPNMQNVNKYTLSTAKKNLSTSEYNSSIENSTDPIDAMHNDNSEITEGTKKISSYMNDDPDLKNFWENLENSDD